MHNWSFCLLLCLPIRRAGSSSVVPQYNSHGPMTSSCKSRWKIRNIWIHIGHGKRAGMVQLLFLLFLLQPPWNLTDSVQCLLARTKRANKRSRQKKQWDQQGYSNLITVTGVLQNNAACFKKKNACHGTHSLVSAWITLACLDGRKMVKIASIFPKFHRNWTTLFKTPVKLLHTKHADYWFV